MELKELSPYDIDLLTELGYKEDVDYVVAEFDFDILTVAMMPETEQEDYSDVFITDDNRLYKRGKPLLDGWYYNKQSGLLFFARKVQYKKIYPKSHEKIKWVEPYSCFEQAEVRWCIEKNDSESIKNSGYNNFECICGEYYVRRRNSTRIDPIIVFRDKYYAPEKYVLRELLPDQRYGMDILYTYERVEYKLLYIFLKQVILYFAG